MKSEHLAQVVVDPAIDPETLAELQVICDREVIQIGYGTAAKLWIGKALHRFGIHYWVKYKTYDPASQRLIEWPKHWVCLHCPEGRVG